MHISFIPHAQTLFWDHLCYPIIAIIVYFSILCLYASVSWMSICNYSEHCKPALLSENVGALTPPSFTGGVASQVLTFLST